MNTIRNKQIFIAIRFQTIKIENFIAAKLNGFTVLCSRMKIIFKFTISIT